jgi:hypothetical protein
MRDGAVVAAIAAPLICATTATAAATIVPVTSAATGAAYAATATTGAAYAATAGAPTITRSAHVALQNCNARHLVLSVTVPKHAFGLSEPVTFKVRLTNTGSATCGTALAQHVPEARSTLTVGPCGSLPLTVRNRGGVEVYPGPAVYFCPDNAGLRLGPHSTVRATAQWSQAAYLGSPPKPQHAPPGTYRLTVDRAVTVPVVLRAEP